jgi:hypothetical protein
MTANLGKSPEAKPRFKQIGSSPFNTGRENLPVKSGADKLRALRFRKMTAWPGKCQEAKSQFKKIGQSRSGFAFQYWRESSSEKRCGQTQVA